MQLRSCFTLLNNQRNRALFTLKIERALSLSYRLNLAERRLTTVPDAAIMSDSNHYTKRINEVNYNY